MNSLEEYLAGSEVHEVGEYTLLHVSIPILQQMNAEHYQLFEDTAVPHGGVPMMIAHQTQ